MNIVYIDDEQDGINTFRRAFLLKEKNTIIYGFTPEYSMEETYNSILKYEDIDAIITDYELSDSCDVNFTGADFIEFILNKHPLLPCFVLTAFEDKAVKSNAVDVYKVYPKSVLAYSTGGSEHEVSFYERVSQQIEKNKRKLLSTQKEHASLLAQKKSDEWTSEQENRLIICDDLLEHYYAGKKISGVLKKTDYNNKIVELIDVTKSLLQEVKNNDHNS